MGCTNWRNETQKYHTVSTLNKASGNLKVNGFVEGKASFKVDTATTVFIVRPYLIATARLNLPFVKYTL